MSDSAKDQLAKDMLASLLDKNLSDVADLPEYLEKVPTGFYKLQIVEVEFKNVEIQEKDKPTKTDAPTVQIAFKLKEVLELEDQDIKPDDLRYPKAGGRFDMTYFMHKEPEKSIEVIKAQFKAVALELGVENVGELLQQLKGLTIGANVKCVEDKNKPDKFYFRISNCQLDKS